MGHGAGSNKPQHHHRSSSFVGAILGSVVGATSAAASGEDGAHQAPEAWHLEEEWFSLLSGEALHYTTTFADAVHESAPKAVFTVTAHFAAQFAALRQRVVQGGEAAFVASMSRCAAWASQGGKSNAYFAKTRDDRFIVKQMAKIEKQSFLEFGPAYFRYLADCMHKDRPTCLAKILGVYEVSIKTSPATSGKGSRGGEGQPTVKVIDVLVMENIFYGHSISRIYDLKGSLRGRYNAAAADPSKSGEVMLDKNLLESMMDHPLCISTADSAELEAALWSDTAFLARLGVMDYSLLVGADSSQSTLVVGVIDFIRQYTIDKQLETLLKSSGLLGGSGQQPTVVSPKQYMRRFRGAMTSYFTVMPDSDPQLPHLNPDH